MTNRCGRRRREGPRPARARDGAARRPGGTGGADRFADSIESRSSWGAAVLAIGILSISYGAPLIVVVGLKPIAASLASDRSVVALAAALVWVGTGSGGILMGWVADRVGVRRTVIFGALMTALGLAVSSIGKIWTLYLGHFLLIGFLGGGALYPPLLIYVSRWFDRRRGTALGSDFVRPIRRRGRLALGVSALAGLVRLAGDHAYFCRRHRRDRADGGDLAAGAEAGARHRLSRNPSPQHSGAGAAAQYRAGAAVRGGFLCCVPMAMPSGHLVALCSDLGIAPAQSAAMLSVLLGSAFVSRQFWGWLADRIGGLGTLLAGSACQALAIAAFSVTKSEAGLFAVSAAYGLGFSGIVPAYVMAIRELFPSIRSIVAGAGPAVYQHVWAWRSAAGSPARSTTVSASTHRLSPPGPCSTSATLRSSVFS